MALAYPVAAAALSWRRALACVLTLVALALGNPLVARGQDEPVADPFAIPEGADAETLLGFIQGLSEPTERFTSREQAMEYMRNASLAISEASDRVLGVDATAAQQMAAVNWQVQALTVLGQVGDREAAQRLDQYLIEMETHPTPQVAGLATRTRLSRTLRRFRGLNPDEREALMEDLRRVATSRTAGVEELRLMAFAGDTLGDAGAGRAGAGLLEDALARFSGQQPPAVAKRVAHLEGVVRRLRLPGHGIALEGVTLEGDRFNWREYRGKVVLIDFWATWCGPCIAELPNVLKQYDAYHEQGFEVVGVALDKELPPVKQFVAERGIPWQNLVGPAPESRGWDHPVAARYAITAIPRAILVDQQGRVVHMNARGEALGAALQRLLGEPVARRGGAGAAAQTAQADQR